MKLIVGLGNPESRYDNTRHNVGFRMLDNYAAVHNATFKHSDKFRADIAEQTIDGEKLLLAKPTTYYNLVGESVRSIIDFYKLTPEDVVIIHDDLALPFGTIRTRIGGSDAGNNGIKSMNQHLGQATSRIRIGVWTEHHEQMDAVSVVLGKFTGDERTNLDDLEPKVAELIKKFATGAFEVTTHR